jgi:hypothetical protein
MKRPHRDRRRGVPTAGRSDPYRSARSVLAELEADVRYLEVKESLGEVLTPRERFALELARDAKREGGEAP